MDPEHAGASPRLRLRLIGLTDLHANLYPYDYYRDRPDDSVGLARAASLIAQARKEAPNCLLFDNGDILQGTPLGDYAAAVLEKDPGATHPVIAAMNSLDYSAATLGNHEFNYGLRVLERAYAGAHFPVVCANIRRRDGSDWFPPSVVVERTFVDNSGAARTLRVGVIGFAPPQIAQWDETHVRGRLMTLDIVEAAGAEVRALKSRVDLIVALCHSGISRLASKLGEENAGLDLARIEGIDALFLGHQHLLLPGDDFAGITGVDAALGTIGEKPAVMAGFGGGHLGVIDLILRSDEGTWGVVDQQVAVRPIARRDEDGAAVALVDSDASVLEAARSAHTGTLSYVRSPVGTLAAPLHTYLALIADDPTVQLVNDAQRAYAAPLVAARTDLASLPILSAAAPFKCGGRRGPDFYTDVASGTIAIKDVADIYPYPNRLQVLKIDGATLSEWLERSASIFCHIDSSSRDEQPLLGPAFVCYNFDVIDGVEYAIDVTEPARYDESGALVAPEARRIRDLTFEGAPVDPKKSFLIVTNNYRASGGGSFPGCDRANVAIEAPDSNRDVVLRHISSAGEIAPKSDGNWRLAPWPSTVVATCLTSPAAALIPPPPGLRLTSMGRAPGGFLKVRVEPAAWVAASRQTRFLRKSRIEGDGEAM